MLAGGLLHAIAQVTPIVTTGNLCKTSIPEYAELVPPTLVLKKTQERSIRRDCVQETLSCYHAFYAKLMRNGSSVGVKFIAVVMETSGTPKAGTAHRQLS